MTDLRIFKYAIPTQRGAFTIKLPWGAKILSIGLQGACDVIWCEVDTTHSEDEITFYMAYTGEPAPQESIYLGTTTIIFNMIGPIVKHYYVKENQRITRC